MEDLSGDETDLLRVAALLGVFDRHTLRVALPEIRSSAIEHFLKRSFVTGRASRVPGSSPALAAAWTTNGTAPSSPRTSASSGPARVGLIPATRPADGLALTGYACPSGPGHRVSSSMSVSSRCRRAGRACGPGRRGAWRGACWSCRALGPGCGVWAGALNAGRPAGGGEVLKVGQLEESRVACPGALAPRPRIVVKPWAAPGWPGPRTGVPTAVRDGGYLCWGAARVAAARAGRGLPMADWLRAQSAPSLARGGPLRRCHPTIAWLWCPGRSRNAYAGCRVSGRQEVRRDCFAPSA